MGRGKSFSKEIRRRRPTPSGPVAGLVTANPRAHGPRSADASSKPSARTAQFEKSSMRHLALNGKQSASRTTPRNINRSLIFNQVRVRQPISRAELSRRTGWQRSTVSIIVEDQIAKRWILEGEIGQVPRGRHPTMIQLNSQRGVLALDIHPSEVTIAVADLSGRVVAQNVFMFPSDPSKVITCVLRGIRKTIKAN